MCGPPDHRWAPFILVRLSAQKEAEGTRAVANRDLGRYLERPRVDALERIGFPARHIDGVATRVRVDPFGIVADWDRLHHGERPSVEHGYRCCILIGHESVR